jgi:hypothetical protein
VGAEADGVEVNHGLIAMIPLFGDDLVECLRLSHIGLRVFNCSAAAIAVSTIVVVSPASAPCKVGRHGGDSRDYGKHYCVFSIA